MRHTASALLLLLAATVATGEELTVDKIISATNLGAPAERIIAEVNSPANTVRPMTSDDILRLRTAGVAGAVVQAMAARSQAAATTPAGRVPDDKRLVNIVTLVQQGLSEGVIAEQVVRSGDHYPLTVNDLVYLKENRVPESIITALLTSGQAAGAGPATAGTGKAAASQTGEAVFEGLVFKKGGVLAKNRSGKLVLTEDKLEWRDAKDPSVNFPLFLKGVEQVTLLCNPREEGNFCFQVELSFAHGDSFAFEDSRREVGGNENLTLFVDTLKQRFPKLPLVEKLKK